MAPITIYNTIFVLYNQIYKIYDYIRSFYIVDIDYESVYRVYQEGSISKAAEKMFMTQPALTIAIQRVEKRVGEPLFDRTKRPMTLTGAGVEYIKMVKEIQSLEEDFQQKIQDIRELNRGNIVIGGSHYLNAYILPEYLAGFTKKYPKITFELVEQGASVIAEMLGEQKMDLTFNCDPELVQRYEHFPAFEDMILLGVPSDHPVNFGYEKYALTPADVCAGKHLRPGCPKIDLKEFKSLDYILLSEGNNLRERSMKMFAEAEFQPNIKLCLSQLVTAYHLAESGFGATFVSDRLVTKGGEGLVFYKLKSEQIRRRFYIILPKRKYVPAATKRFIEYFLYFS